MIDTNQIAQVAQNVADVKSTIAPYWPAICAGLLWLRSELKMLFNHGMEFAEYCIAHGGVLRFIGKVFWNKGGDK